MKPNSNIPNSNLPSGKVEQLLKDITALRDEVVKEKKEYSNIEFINECIGQINAYDKSIELINNSQLTTESTELEAAKKQLEALQLVAEKMARDVTITKTKCQIAGLINVTNMLNAILKQYEQFKSKA
jgi:hypothetical protein